MFAVLAGFEFDFATVKVIDGRAKGPPKLKLWTPCYLAGKMMLKKSQIDKTNITGIILAGGRSTRMGGQDKGLMLLNGKYMIEYVIATLRPQVCQILISANRNIDQYTQISACPVVADSFGHYDGPLAGMVTTLAKAQTDYVLFVPCDSPLLSPHLAERLYHCLIQSNADISVADDGSRIHPVFSLFKCDVLTELKAFLKTGERGIRHFLAQQSSYATADFSESKETFSNVNTLEELSIISEQLSQN